MYIQDRNKLNINKKFPKTKKERTKGNYDIWRTIKQYEELAKNEHKLAFLSDTIHDQLVPNDTISWIMGDITETERQLMILLIGVLFLFISIDICYVSFLLQL